MANICHHYRKDRPPHDRYGYLIEKIIIQRERTKEPDLLPVELSLLERMNNRGRRQSARGLRYRKARFTRVRLVEIKKPARLLSYFHVIPFRTDSIFFDTVLGVTRMVPILPGYIEIYLRASERHIKRREIIIFP